MIDLTGQHIFIAGGSRGIGAETARMVARAGASVSVAFKKNATSAENVVESIRHAGGRAVAYAGDLSVDGIADELVESAVNAHGPLTGMVVSAGVFEAAPILEMTAEFWDNTMAVNLRATFLCVRARRFVTCAHRAPAEASFSSRRRPDSVDRLTIQPTRHRRAAKFSSCAPWPAN